MLSARSGVTLIEMLVAMVVGGIALGLVASISVRQQRLYADLAVGSAQAAQVRDAASVLPIDLRSISPVSGDIRDALDTAVEFRSTIASAVVCDTAHGMLVLPPPTSGSTFTSLLDTPAAGDTAWLFVPGASPPWRPRRIAGVSSTIGGQCDAGGPQLPPSALTARRVTLSLDSAIADASGGPPIGAALRVTRPLRYSLYHAPDNLWYLGARDWNSVSQRFNTIQPVSGPFLSAANRGIAFTFLDSAGATVPTPVVDTRRIAAIRVGLRGQGSAPARILGGAHTPGVRVDSSIITVVLHNR